MAEEAKRPEDAVDVIVRQWRAERPDLDPSAKEISGRIVRLADLFQRRYAAAFEAVGLTDGDYGLLAALRRSGEPFALTPTDLARARMMTSGGMTAVIDRLARQGLVERIPNPNDRRGSLVRLTDVGRAKVDEAMPRHAAAEQELVARLDERDRDRLVDLLRTLLLDVEGPPPSA